MTGRPPTIEKLADTPLALLRAAEILFADKGIDAVSMREIAARAGQANHSAVLYHFHDKKALINALLERHSGPMQESWLVTLERMGPEGRESLESLVRLMVQSLVALLDDPDGGPEYLLIVADLVTSRSFPLMSFPAVSAPGILELTARMMKYMDEVSPEIMQLRMMRVAAVLYSSIANYHSNPHLVAGVPREVFIDDLVASIVVVIRCH